MSRRPFVLPSPRDPHCLRLGVRAPGRRYRRHCPGPIRGAVTAGGGPGSRAGSDADAPEAPPAVVEVENPDSAGEVEIRRIGSWVSSGVKGSRRLVIRDPKTLAAFWSELGAGVRPEVNFSRDLVIAVASGEHSSGGHQIVVQQVTRDGGELRIEVVDTSPGPDCMTTSALTQPVDVVLVPADGVKGWSFIDRKATNEC